MKPRTQKRQKNYTFHWLKIVEGLLSERKRLKRELKVAKAVNDERLMTYEERQALQKVLDYLHEESNDYDARKEEGKDVSGHIWESMVILIDYLQLDEHLTC
ncbi:MAG TPA: hypothetical protein VFA15_00200 [Nitrososphaera sp.]|nr:hypothetical protein [Nitrososphaera sp.]